MTITIKSNRVFTIVETARQRAEDTVLAAMRKEQQRLKDEIDEYYWRTLAEIEYRRFERIRKNRL
jgi:hypothetical protein